MRKIIARTGAALAGLALTLGISAAVAPAAQAFSISVGCQPAHSLTSTTGTTYYFGCRTYIVSTMSPKVYSFTVTAR